MPRRILALLVPLLLLPAACGGEDGGGTRPLDPAAALAALQTRVASGVGISDATWTRDVQDVGLALWPEAPGELGTVRQAGRMTHTNLAHIAGDMAVQLARGGAEARAAWQTSDPGSLEIHDAFLAAAALGPDGYRPWVEGPGADLLRRRIESLGGR